MASMHLTASHAPSISRPIHPAPALNLKQFLATIRQLLWVRKDAAYEIRQVLERAATDDRFLACLAEQGSPALAGYRLDTRDKAALVSGDIRWIESRTGKLDSHLRTWFNCRLQQESW